MYHWQKNKVDFHFQKIEVVFHLKENWGCLPFSKKWRSSSIYLKRGGCLPSWAYLLSKWPNIAFLILRQVAGWVGKAGIIQLTSAEAELGNTPSGLRFHQTLFSWKVKLDKVIKIPKLIKCLLKIWKLLGLTLPAKARALFYDKLVSLPPIQLPSLRG